MPGIQEKHSQHGALPGAAERDPSARPQEFEWAQQMEDRRWCLVAGFWVHRAVSPSAKHAEITPTALVGGLARIFQAPGCPNQDISD
jgi:hypothetical protein